MEPADKLEREREREKNRAKNLVLLKNYDFIVLHVIRMTDKGSRNEFSWNLVVFQLNSIIFKKMFLNL